MVSSIPNCIDDRPYVAAAGLAGVELSAQALFLFLAWLVIADNIPRHRWRP